MGQLSRDLRRAVPPSRRGDLLARGVPRRELATGLWRRAGHGWYVPGHVPQTPAQRIVQAATLVPAGRIGGWAAAYALGCDVLDGRDPWTGRDLPVLVVHPPGGGPLDPVGVRCVRSSLPEDEVVERHGLRVTGALRTAVDLACGAPTLTEAVVALDALLAAQIVRPDAVRDRFATIEGVRGARQARRAAELCRTRVRSPWETRLRMFVVLELGLPEPLVNVPVFDDEGRFVGAPDLLDEEAGIALEFDGAGHRDRRQHREDNVREEDLERTGLVVVRADSVDLRAHRDQLGRRVLAGRAAGLARPAWLRRWSLQEPPWWRGLPA